MHPLFTLLLSLKVLSITCKNFTSALREKTNISFKDIDRLQCVMTQYD